MEMQNPSTKVVQKTRSFLTWRRMDVAILAHLASDERLSCVWTRCDVGTAFSPHPQQTKKKCHSTFCRRLAEWVCDAWNATWGKAFRLSLGDRGYLPHVFVTHEQFGFRWGRVDLPLIGTRTGWRISGYEGTEDTHDATTMYGKVYPAWFNDK